MFRLCEGILPPVTPARRASALRKHYIGTRLNPAIAAGRRDVDSPYKRQTLGLQERNRRRALIAANGVASRCALCSVQFADLTI